MRLENTITLPGILPLKKEVLGNEFKIIVGERHGTIAFPLLPDNYKDFSIGITAQIILQTKIYSRLIMLKS